MNISDKHITRISKHHTLRKHDQSFPFSHISLNIFSTQFWLHKCNTAQPQPENWNTDYNTHITFYNEAEL